MSAKNCSPNGFLVTYWNLQNKTIWRKNPAVWTLRGFSWNCTRNWLPSSFPLTIAFPWSERARFYWPARACYESARPHQLSHVYISQNGHAPAWRWCAFCMCLFRLTWSGRVNTFEGSHAGWSRCLSKNMPAGARARLEAADGLGQSLGPLWCGGKGMEEQKSETPGPKEAPSKACESHGGSK